MDPITRAHSHSVILNTYSIYRTEVPQKKPFSLATISSVSILLQLGGSNAVNLYIIYEGGDLICWELKVIVELKPGDMFFFPAHLITHSNTEVKGERHSLVAFTQQKVLNWFGQRYNCVDDRDIA